MRARRGDNDLTDILPVGETAVRDLLQRHIDQGLTKFVLRSVDAGDDWRDNLEWLAQTVLGLQA